MTIDRENPNTWQDLQQQVHQILNECGFESEVEKRLDTVRGTVTIDVYARDPSSQPPVVYLCECKHWHSRVPQGVVHSFRTVVTDYGANWGFIISSNGFQSGAHEAAANSNVKLLTWNEFQTVFADKWVEEYMIPHLHNVTDPLVEYIEPINSRIFRKAARLSKDLQKRFIELRERWDTLGFLAQRLFIGIGFFGEALPQLPLRPSNGATPRLYEKLPDEVIDAACLRDFLDSICTLAVRGIAEFDELFGERA